ncbi:TRAP transporter large permease subunit [Guyparkeria hydrothermalis]|uniref:TRAP transporter large permease n=1 Tax=Guyparkeria hydrothermalis TaxID=923 RepID=UPI00202233A0|nr:TRAP transporter large permease subunit [Guyparkeria hydrothermalis]MCL7743572.1 TRAP transporter large permease subunit [Guyparkeria hydrothermalis]
MDSYSLALMMVGALLVLIFAGVPVAFSIAAAGIVFGLIGLGDMIFNLLPARIFGVITNYTLLAIPLFVFMGVLLEKSRIAESAIDVVGHLAGDRPGGMAIAIIVIGVLMGASTGIVGATVVAVGLITLPKLLSRGYHPSLASGTICASGTLGQIIPPSLLIILLADIMGESVGELFAAAIVPSMLLAALYLVYLIILGRFVPQHAPPIPRAERDAMPRRELWLKVIKTVVPPVLLVVSVLGSIIGGVAAPTEAASLGALGAMAIVAAMGRLDKATLMQTMRDTLKLTGMIMLVLIAAQAFALSFRLLGGEEMINDLFSWVPGGTTGAILFMLVVLFVLGFFLEWIEISYIVLPLMLPVFAAANVDVIWLAMLVTLVLQTSFLTPPFGWALFFLKGVAPPEVKTKHLYLGVLPFIGLQLLTLAIVFIFPSVATGLPQSMGW